MTSSFFTRKKMMMVGAKRSALDEAHGRLVIVKLAFALLFVLIAARLVDLSFIQGEVRKHMAQGEVSQSRMPDSKKLSRGDVVDRNGTLLAMSLETASLYADPRMVADPESLAANLVKIMPDLTYGDVLQKLQRKGRFIWIKRNLTPEEQYKVLMLGDPAVAFKTEMRRIYPQGPLTAQMVGYTDVDGNGLSGVERSFNSYLKKGSDPLKLTIDIRLQHVLRRETLSEVKKFNAKGGAGIIMDIKTGEVLAAVSLPDYDPHDPGAASAQAIFNNVTLGVYELGSTFKLFTTAALLELKNTPMSATFDARESIKRGRFTIADYHAEKRIMTVPEIFMHSSNIGSGLMAEAVGTEAFKDFYKDLGLLSKMDFEIEEVGTPLYPQPWRDINTLTASFGHGIAVTPLQMVSAAAGIVGGGTLVKPTIIIGNKADDTKKKTEVRIVSEETAHKMRQLLRLVVSKGTGAKADVPGFTVGGKTGTAEKPGVRGYDRKRLISSFLGFFPMEAPRYAIFIMVDEPTGNKSSYGYATGGWVAAPAVGRTIAGMAAILGVQPKTIPAEKDIAAPLHKYLHDKKQLVQLPAIEPATGEADVTSH